MCHLEQLFVERRKQQANDDDDDFGAKVNDSSSATKYNNFCDDGTTIEDDDARQHSNMYDYMKAQPRMWFKSHGIRNLFARYGKKRNPN